MSVNNKLKFSHIIWDWNGTIVDDTGLCVRIVNQILDEFKLEPLTVEFYRNNFGFPVSDYYKKIGLPSDIISYNKISNIFINKYRKLFYTTGLHNHVVDCIKQFQVHKISQSILSASKINDLKAFTAYYKINHYFSKLTGVDNILANGKFDIANAHLVELFSQRSEILLIGDTIHDAEIASQLGINCLLFSGGHNSKKLLSSCPFPVVDCFKDVLYFVLD